MRKKFFASFFKKEVLACLLACFLAFLLSCMSVGASSSAIRMHVHHIVTQSAWATARNTGQHAPPELARDGFLHCCKPSQLDFVLARHFAGVSDLLVLTFDPAAVPAELRWVKSEPDQEPFPHLYGPLPCAAVSSTMPPPQA